MRGKIQFVFCACILLSVSFPIQARAEYYENHVDRGDYCMQAKDVCITDAQRAAWLEDGTLEKKLLEKSEVFTNLFHPSNSTRYWSEYDGSYEIDLEAIKDLAFQEGDTSKSVPVTIRLSDIEEAFITINVKVTVSEQSLPNDGDAAQMVQADGIDQKTGTLRIEDDYSKNTSGQGMHKERWCFVWLFMTILAFLGYGGSLYSDFKVLRKYKQKRIEREGKE